MPNSDDKKAALGLQIALEVQATARQESEKRYRLLKEARQVQLIQLAIEARPWILQEAAERVSHRSKQADVADSKLREATDTVQRCCEPAAQLPLSPAGHQQNRLQTKSDKVNRFDKFNQPFPPSKKRRAADRKVYDDDDKENYSVVQSEQPFKRSRLGDETILLSQKQINIGFVGTAECSANNINEPRKTLAQRDFERHICRKGIKEDTKREIERIQRAETKRLRAIDEEEKRDHENVAPMRCM